MTAMTRLEQLHNLAAFYRSSSQPECAEAIEWAIKRIASLETDVLWWIEAVGDRLGAVNDRILARARE